MLDLTIESTVLKDGTRIVAVDGELDLATAPRFEGALEAAIDGQPDADDTATTVIVDLTGCQFVDSSALAVLIRASRRLEEPGALSLIVPHKNVRRVFEITHVDNLFTIYPSRSEALEGRTV